jgi:hypothetical protein
MILKLDKTEISVLLLHLAMMRNNVKKFLKKKENGKEILQSFDEVKIALENVMEDIDIEESENKLFTFHFNIKEIEMLESFLAWYPNQLENTLKQAGKVKNEDKKQLECLKKIHDQLKQVLAA